MAWKTVNEGRRQFPDFDVEFWPGATVFWSPLITGCIPGVGDRRNWQQPLSSWSPRPGRAPKVTFLEVNGGGPELFDWVKASLQPLASIYSKSLECSGGGSAPSPSPPPSPELPQFILPLRESPPNNDPSPEMLKTTPTG